MVKILFVCHGNICRSPMAEFIMKKMVRERGLDREFVIASAATSREELGNPVYPPAKRILFRHGITCNGKTAVQMTRADYGKYDYIVAMDKQNLRNITRIIGNDSENKVSLLLDFTDFPRSVADPWYSGDFETAYADIEEGCEALLAEIIRKMRKESAQK